MEKNSYQAPACTLVQIDLQQHLATESMTMSGTKVTQDNQVFSREGNGHWDDEE